MAYACRSARRDMQRCKNKAAWQHQLAVHCHLSLPLLTRYPCSVLRRMLPRYMSGYQTRFLATIKELTAMGCDVLVVTPGETT